MTEARLSGGEGSELDQHFIAAYDELRNRARSLLRRERADHTLQATALVHEAYAKLASSGGPTYEGRTHFCRIAARAMRQVLVNWARDRTAKKRGGEAPGGGGRWHRLDLTSADALGLLSVEDRAWFLLDLNAALERLEAHLPRQAQALELSFFGGLTQKEIAEELGVVEKTVQRDLKKAWRWLRELGGHVSSPSASA